MVDEPSFEELADAIRKLEVGQFLLSMISTLTSVVYGKLEQGELAQAKVGIDALAALMPVLNGQVEDEFLHGFERALADLQVAYASASSAKPD
ncbi:MAG TPA: hypothetical protein VGL76_07385 [Gaiellaceae bacterium]